MMKPITSYGLIVYYKDKYLAIRRRDSYAYIDFFRGKWDDFCTLFNNMTVQEQNLILTFPIQELLEDFNGTHIVPQELLDKYNGIDWEQVRTSDKSLSENLMWTFPRGRKNFGESFEDCAIREFREETNISDYVKLKPKKFIYSYIGTDGKKYRTVYFVGLFSGDITIKYQQGKIRSKISDEVSEIQWVSLDQAQKIFDKKFYDLLVRVDSYIK